MIEDDARFMAVMEEIRQRRLKPESNFYTGWNQTVKMVPNHLPTLDEQEGSFTDDEGLERPRVSKYA